VLHHDGVIAIRAGRDHGHRNARDLFNTLQIQARIAWQLVVLCNTNGGLTPAVHDFVHRNAARDIVSSHGQQVDMAAIQHVAGA